MKDLSRIAADWDDLAKIDAAWFNVPSDRILNHTWDIEDFFKSGKSHIQNELLLINQQGIRLTKGIALDFGCGIGRITQALSEEFNTCYGVDISSEMIKRANKYNNFKDKCIYAVNQRDDLNIFEDSFFDFVYSTNVLQHVSPATMKKYIVEFIRVIKEDGVLMFQVPLQRLTVDEYTKYLKSLPKFHPRRIVNKLRGLIIGHDEVDRYYKLLRFGFSKKWLFTRFGFHPNINMYCLEEKEFYDLVARQKCSVAYVGKYEYKGMLNAKFIVIKLPK